MTQERTSITSALETILGSWASKINTNSIGQIVSFDRDKGTASIAPALQRKYEGEDEPVSLPVIEDVPVFINGSGDRWLAVDLAIGSYVLLIFSQRAIATWLQEGGIVDPIQNRKFAMSDAIALAGIQPLSEALSPGIDEEAISMRTRDNTSHVRIDADGDIQVNANSGAGPLELNGGGGTAVEFARLKIEFNQMKSELNNLIAAYNAHTQPVAGVLASAPNPPIPPITLPIPSIANIDLAESDTVEIP